jgi:hypothetical protein
VRQQLRRIVEPIHFVAGLGEQVRVPPLAAGAIQDARSDRELEDVDQAGDFTPVARQVEQRLVLEEIRLVEVRSPPLLGQKKTGSRYAPNTSSSAARISYSVQ